MALEPCSTVLKSRSVEYSSFTSKAPLARTHTVKWFGPGDPIIGPCSARG